MTERLSDLLHTEADLLDVPPPDPAGALRRGRGVRRRRKVVAATAALALVVVAGGTALGLGALAGGDGGGDAVIDPAAPSGTGPVFSLGDTVYLDGGQVVATIDDIAVKSMYYTSAGLLVRHGDNPYSDGGGPQRFSLVRPDGTVEPIGVTTEETVPGTDASEPYLAYAEVTDGEAEVVVRDLRDDTEAARVAIPSADPGGGWSGPPVGLSGDTVYAGTGDGLFAVDWRTGDVQKVEDRDQGSIPDIHGGRETWSAEGEATVVDSTTGETLLTVPIDGYGYLDLSPDGRYAELVVEEADLSDDPGFDVYDVASGEHVTIPGASYDYGWTVDGDLFRVGERDVTTCEAGTGACTSSPHGVEMPAATPQERVCTKTRDGRMCTIEGGDDWRSLLKLGGRTYES